MPTSEEHFSPRLLPGPRPVRSTVPASVLTVLALNALALGTLALGILGCSPDPATAPATQVRHHLDRGTVFIDIDETMDGEESDVNIAELLVGRSFLHHGFHFAPEETARYRVTGTLTCTYHQDLTIELAGVEQHLEHQWDSMMHITIEDRGEDLANRDDPTLTVYSFPQPLRNGRIEDAAARRDVRRRAATEMLDMIWLSPEFGTPKIVQAINALTDRFEPRTFNEIMNEIIAYGPTAVPYLLAALSDERPVGPDGTYPGLEEFNRERLMVYHLADVMLGEILLRQPGLDLLATTDRRVKVGVGWTWAWEDAIEIPETYRVRASERATSVKDRAN